MSRTHAWLLAVPFVIVSAAQAGLGDSLRTVEITDGIGFPTFLTAASGDDQRLFVAERAGRIRVIKDGVLLVDPFLDISAQVGQAGEGALGAVAFHPQYQANGRFYVAYTDLAGDGIIVRFDRGADDDHADPASEEILLTVDEPGDIHNIGWMGFGADGYLYIGSGDGANNDGRFAQDLDRLLGKIIRIDVDGGTPYAIPSDNPFVGKNGLDEIWAIGLRNPWRCSFDRQTGDLWIGDVGKNSYEEIDFLPAGSPSPANFGWNCMEGNQCFPEGMDCICDDAALTDPIHDYPREVGHAVIGGYVYRGSGVPQLTGLYVYGDWWAARVWAFDRKGDTVTPLFDGINGLVSFGEDNDGELYVLSIGKVQKIVRAADFDADGAVAVTDLLLLLGAWGPCPAPPDPCLPDLNGDGQVNVTDLLALLSEWDG